MHHVKDIFCLVVFRCGFPVSEGVERYLFACACMHGRVVKQMINSDDRKQHVNYLIFYDKWYPTGIKKFPVGEALPDVFIFPENIPTKLLPCPRLPNADEDVFLKALYRFVGKRNNLKDPEVKRHIWNCEIKIFQTNRQWKRQLKVTNELYPALCFHRSGVSTSNVKAIPPLRSDVNRSISEYHMQTQ